MTDETRTERLSAMTSLAALVLVGAHLAGLLTDGGTYLVALHVAALVVAAPAAVLMTTRRCLECQVAASIVAVASAAGVLLDATVGLPGRAPHALTVTGGLLLASGFLVPVLVGWTVFARRTPVDEPVL